MQLVNFDAFHLMDLFLTQPIQIVAGEDAGIPRVGSPLRMPGSIASCICMRTHAKPVVHGRRGLDAVAQHFGELR